MTSLFYAFTFAGCALMVFVPMVMTAPATIGVLLWLLYAVATLTLAYVAVHQDEG